MILRFWQPIHIIKDYLSKPRQLSPMMTYSRPVVYLGTLGAFVHYHYTPYRRPNSHIYPRC